MWISAFISIGICLTTAPPSRESRQVYMAFLFQEYSQLYIPKAFLSQFESLHDDGDDDDGGGDDDTLSNTLASNLYYPASTAPPSSDPDDDQESRAIEISPEQASTTKFETPDLPEITSAHAQKYNTVL
ncbi:hypothetical protein DPMN_019733 [Dreissena polymorpha]|uniref:Uncharacterized protein n=1 Tax=Dreissena polymorpha TaxID=45954 RepID=A0A9D4NJ18_DREPO|nr:hypothetical protein DPMN_019733 [Dreissena polymorpha]